MDVLGPGQPGVGSRPKHDVSLTDGQALTVGDVAFTAVAIPGHTPRSLGHIFPVKDGVAHDCWRPHTGGMPPAVCR